MFRTAAIVFISLMLIFSMYGCGTNEENIRTDFTDLISGKATAENIHTIADFLDENIAEVDGETATQMISAYREYLLNYIIQNEDKTTVQELSVYFDEKSGLIDTEKIQNSEFKEYYEHIKAGCLMMLMREGAVVLKVDHTKLLEKYGDYISEPTKALYQFEAELIEKPTSQNATLAVSWDELLERTYIAERLLRDYPNEEHITADAMWIYTSHLNTLLMGTTNTPVFDYATKEFSEAAKTAYQNFILSEPDAVLTWVLKEYFTYLNSIDYTLDFNDSTMSKVFFDTCDWLVTEAEKRVRE
jgi:hypothetical protein